MHTEEANNYNTAKALVKCAYGKKKDAITLLKMTDKKERSNETIRLIASYYTDLACNQNSMAIHYYKKAIKHYKSIKEKTFNDECLLLSARIDLAMSHRCSTKPNQELSHTLFMSTINRIIKLLATTTDLRNINRLYQLMAEISEKAPHSREMINVLSNYKGKYFKLTYSLSCMYLQEGLRAKSNNNLGYAKECIKTSIDYFTNYNLLSELGNYSTESATLSAACRHYAECIKEIRKSKLPPTETTSPTTKISSYKMPLKASASGLFATYKGKSSQGVASEADKKCSHEFSPGPSKA